MTMKVIIAVWVLSCYGQVVMATLPCELNLDRGCTNQCICGARQRHGSLFPDPSIFGLSPTKCPYKPTNCSGECLPTCEAFAGSNASNCSNFAYPGPPKIDVQADKIVWTRLVSVNGNFITGGFIKIRWSCPTTNPGNTVGFRVNLRDGDTKAVLETFDVSMHRILHPAGGTGRQIVHFFPHADVSIEHFLCGNNVNSKVLSRNFNGNFMKAQTSWRLIVQVLSLPVNGSVDLDSPQSTAVTVTLPSCREENCPRWSADKAAQLTCPTPSPAITPVLCECVPLAPAVGAVLPTTDPRQWTIEWTMSDQHFMNVSFFVLTLNASANGMAVEINSEVLGHVRSHNITLPIAIASEGDFVTVQATAGVYRDVQGESQRERVLGATSAPKTFIMPSTTSAPADPTSAQSSASAAPESAGQSDKTWLVPVIVMVLVAIALALVLVLVLHQHKQKEARNRKKPLRLLNQPDIRARIWDTVREDDVENIFNILITNNTVTMMSPEYRKISDAPPGERLGKIVEVIRHGPYSAYGVFLYALRYCGYENLFDHLKSEDVVLKEVMDKVDTIVYPAPPEPTPKQWKRVYVSYSRFVPGHSVDVHHLCEMLAAHSITAILDDYYSEDMADNEVAWISEQFEAADFVVVVLDSTYPLGISRDAERTILDIADDSRLRRTQVECQLLQGGMYRGIPDFVIPVMFDAVEVPSLLRSKTFHRLPHRFLSNHEQFQRLVCRILGQELHSAGRENNGSPDAVQPMDVDIGTYPVQESRTGTSSLLTNGHDMNHTVTV